MPAVSDAQIAAYVAANIGNPAAIAAAAAQFGVTVSDLSRATGAAPAAVTSYFAASNVAPPANPIPAPVPIPVKIPVAAPAPPVSAPSPKPPDQVIHDFVVAHIDQPAVISQVAQSAGVSVADLARATSVQADQVTSYFAAAGVPAPGPAPAAPVPAAPAAPSPAPAGPIPVPAIAAPAAPAVPTRDQVILDFVVAHIDQPAVISQVAQSAGVSVADLARATSVQADQVTSYFAAAGVPAPNDRSPDPRPAAPAIAVPFALDPSGPMAKIYPDSTANAFWHRTGNYDENTGQYMRDAAESAALALAFSLGGKDPREVYTILLSHPELVDSQSTAEFFHSSMETLNPDQQVAYAALKYAGVTPTPELLASYGLQRSDIAALMNQQASDSYNMIRAEDQSMPGYFALGLGVMAGLAFLPALSAVTAPVEVAGFDIGSGLAVDASGSVTGGTLFSGGAIDAATASLVPGVSSAAEIGGAIAIDIESIPEFIEGTINATQAVSTVVPTLQSAGFSSAEIQAGIASYNAMVSTANAALISSMPRTIPSTPGASAAQSIATAAPPAVSSLPSASTIGTALSAGKTLLPALLPHPTAPGQVLPIGSQTPIRTITAGTNDILPILLGVGALLLISG